MAKLSAKEATEFLNTLRNAQRVMMEHAVEASSPSRYDADAARAAARPYTTAALALERLARQVSRGDYDPEVL